MAEVPGGTGEWRKLAVAFYGRVERDPALRPLFPGKTLHCAIEEFTAFMVQLFGGPAADTQRRWWLSLRESHLRFEIGQKERTAWMANMVKALDDVEIEEPARGTLRGFFERASEYVVKGGESGGDAIWDGQVALDDAVAAVREGDAARAIDAAKGPLLRARFERNRSLFAGFLVAMMKSRHPAMRRYVEEELTRDRALVGERYAGRTPLHGASGMGDPAMVELLLRLGADANAQDGGGHGPLYSAANECRGSEGVAVVLALVKGGAAVNANDGVKRCTALHMAARRGNAEVAGALLDCGAEIEARDSVGDTPLRRAVNCDKVQVASVLLARGADARSMRVGRSVAMRELLEAGKCTD